MYKQCGTKNCKNSFFLNINQRWTKKMVEPIKPTYHHVKLMATFQMKKYMHILCYLLADLDSFRNSTSSVMTKNSQLKTIKHIFFIIHTNHR